MKSWVSRMNGCREYWLGLSQEAMRVNWAQRPEHRVRLPFQADESPTPLCAVCGQCPKAGSNPQGTKGLLYFSLQIPLSFASHIIFYCVGEEETLPFKVLPSDAIWSTQDRLMRENNQIVLHTYTWKPTSMRIRDPKTEGKMRYM